MKNGDGSSNTQKGVILGAISVGTRTKLPAVRLAREVISVECREYSSELA